MMIEVRFPVKRLRRYIVAGLLVWIPLGVTIFLHSCRDRFDGPYARPHSAKPYRPEAWLGFEIPGLGVVLTFLVAVDHR